MNHCIPSIWAYVYLTTNWIFESLRPNSHKSTILSHSLSFKFTLHNRTNESFQMSSIKEAFNTLDSVNLQKFDLVSKAMAAATDFVHQLIKTSEITASVSVSAAELFVNPRTSYYPDWVKGIIVISDGVTFQSTGSKNIITFEGRNVMVKSTTGTTFLKETIPTDRATKFILTLLAATRSMLDSFEINPSDETELKQIILVIKEMKERLKK